MRIFFCIMLLMSPVFAGDDELLFEPCYMVCCDGYTVENPNPQTGSNTRKAYKSGVKTIKEEHDFINGYVKMYRDNGFKYIHVYILDKGECINDYWIKP